MKVEINLDDGYTIRVHPGYGMEVFMKKSNPGVFYNAHGDEISAVLAKEAGFPTEQLLAEKDRRGKVAEAEAAINKMYAGAGKETIVKERRGYALVDIGFDRFVVKDPHGHPVNANPVGKDVGEKLFDQLVPEGTKTKALSGA